METQKYSVLPSEIHGKGVFSNSFIKKKEIIGIAIILSKNNITDYT